MISLYSQNLENAVNEISKLPGIGKRSALRLALHLIKQDEANVTLLTDRITAAHHPAAFRPCGE